MDVTVLIGKDQQTIQWWQMCARSIVVFTYALLALRVAGRRIFGKGSALDTVVAIVLGSTLSRTVTGNARLGPTLAACTMLIGVHFILARITLLSPLIARIVKGSEVPIARDRIMDRRAMRRHNLTEGDLLEALRLKAGQTDPAAVRAAFLERNGEVSVILEPDL